MKKIFFITVNCIFLLICNLPSHAIGFGLYGSIAGGEMTYGRIGYNFYRDDFGFKAPVINNMIPNISGGGGIIIDTNCSRDELFNYRLMIGFDKLFTQRYYIKKMTRMNVSNTFGFGVVRTDLIRFWLGPQLSFHYLHGVNNYPMRALLKSNYTGNKLEYSAAGIGLGLSLGLNINLENNITLSFEGGMRGNIYYGNMIQDNNLMYSQMIYRYVPDTESAWCISSSYEGYGYLSVMYRVKDSFQQKTDDLREKKLK